MANAGIPLHDDKFKHLKAGEPIDDFIFGPAATRPFQIKVNATGDTLDLYPVSGSRILLSFEGNQKVQHGVEPTKGVKSMRWSVVFRTCQSVIQPTMDDSTGKIAAWEWVYDATGKYDN